MGIAQTLQESLERANSERFRWHDTVQEFDHKIVELKATAQRAKAQKDSVTSVHDDLRAKYHELRNYCNGLTDPDARNALAPDLEERAQEVNRMVRRMHEADEAYRQWQRKVADFEGDRANAFTNLTRATQRWEQIQTQIANLGPNL
jgi:chromosome segregation ATPase